MCFAQPVAVRASAARAQSVDDALIATGDGADREPTSCLQAEQGDLIMHSGQMVHGAGAVTRGRRYILIMFVNELVDAEQCLEHGEWTRWAGKGMAGGRQ